MYICRIVIRNFRNFLNLDLALRPGVTCIIGENNSGKTNLLHAIRLALDANLSSYQRQLSEEDFNSTLNIKRPQHIVVSLEFNDYIEHENECALVGQWEVTPDRARLHYRFRPLRAVREEIEEESRQPDSLTLDDYHWEITGGGDVDPSEVTWDQEMGSAVRFADLQQFQVVFLPALRDVQQDLRQSRISPLGRIFAATDIPVEEKDRLVDILRHANEQIDTTPTIKSTGEAIRASFAETAGEAYKMDVRLGMADPSFASISRSLTVLMSNEALTDFDPSRNGLGLNNVLYISMIIEHFKRRIENRKTAGQLLLFEEPEAHLHPQLQRVLYGALSAKTFQTILSTHSTHISSQAPANSIIALTPYRAQTCDGCSLTEGAGLNERETADIERYLDATRSTLLYARKVMLVEGPGELFLLPPLVKQVLNVDLERLGITVIPIYGVHFDVYAKLFSRSGLRKKCAIVADGDLKPSDCIDVDIGEDMLLGPPDLDSLAGDYVRVFRCRTTFERALVMKGTLLFLSETATECGATNTAKSLKAAYKLASKKTTPPAKETALLEDMRMAVLRCAQKVGKARFAQVASKHVRLAEELPAYIKTAIDWLLSE